MFLVPAPPAAAQPCLDCDADGFERPADCNDADPGVFPGAAETCDGRDSDCNGLTDDDASCARACAAPDTIWPPAPLITTSGNFTNPAIVWGANEFGIAFTDSVAGEIRFVRLAATGEPLGPPVLVSTHAPVFNGFGVAPARPSLAWTGSEFGIAWHNPEQGAGLRFARLDAAGQLIDETVFLDCTADACEYPSIVWTGQGYGVIWRDVRFGLGGANNLHFLRLEGDGSPIGAEIPVTDNVFDGSYPHLAWNGSEFGFGLVKLSDVYFQRLAPDGTSLAPATLITNPQVSSTEPRVLWADNRWALEWRSSGGVILLTFLDASGNRIAGDVQIAPSNSRTRLVWTGTEYGLLWDDHDGDRYFLTFARLDAAGARIGADIPVLVTSTSPLHPDLAWNGERYQIAYRAFREVDPFVESDLGTNPIRCDCLVNADGDAATECSDCDDSTGSVYPGSPQACDGLNNDCTHPIWPSIAGTNESDDDGDGASECAGDCDDALSNVFSGAPQVCDGQNNDCGSAGWPSLDGLNETGDCLITLDVEAGGDLDWQSAAPYERWNLYRGNLAVLRATPPQQAEATWTQSPGSNPLAAQSCSLTQTTLVDSVVPAAGEVAFYLVTGMTGSVESGLDRWRLPGEIVGNRVNGAPCP